MKSAKAIDRKERYQKLIDDAMHLHPCWSYDECKEYADDNIEKYVFWGDFLDIYDEDAYKATSHFGLKIYGPITIVMNGLLIVFRKNTFADIASITDILFAILGIAVYGAILSIATYFLWIFIKITSGYLIELYTTKFRSKLNDQIAVDVSTFRYIKEHLNEITNTQNEHLRELSIISIAQNHLRECMVSIEMTILSPIFTYIILDLIEFFS